MKPRTILIPYEHGAWVILFASFLIGWSTAPIRSFAPLWVLPAAAGAYCALYPTQLIIKKLILFRNSKISVPLSLKSELLSLSLFAPVTLALAGLMFFVFGWWELFMFVGFASVAIGIHLYTTAVLKKRFLTADLLNITAMTTVAGATYAASVGGVISQEALILWILSTFYFCGSAIYIKKKIMIYNRENTLPTLKDAFRYMALPLLFWMGGLGTVLLMQATLKDIPNSVPLALIPGMARCLWGTYEIRRRSVKPKEVGRSELWTTSLFVLILIIGS